jgi:hypothetical protein
MTLLMLCTSRASFDHWLQIVVAAFRCGRLSTHSFCFFTFFCSRVVAVPSTFIVLSEA